MFTDKASGKNTQRPQLELLLTFVREGDTVVIQSMDRLSRNLDDLRRIVQALTQRDIQIDFVKERLIYRQSEMFTRQGVQFHCSLLSQWVGLAHFLLQPLYDALQKHVFSAEVIHGGNGSLDLPPWAVAGIDPLTV